ncbi:MAG: metal-dependent transcriptional regulator [Spirochaetaceae bacterium]|nr:MAG: metal-dependent transcriptional regulator [Spirochaetaceae bacterium]
MATSTVEQYIKTIYQEEERTRTPLVQMKRLSRAMEVTPGTATSMVKHLADNALVQYTPRKGVTLTSRGRKLALGMIRRHRLIETFLEQVLEYDWSDVHDDAERLEHAVSDTFVERLDKYLGFPDRDPHGDPIPSAELVMGKSGSIPLRECTVGRSFSVARVKNAGRDRLAFMKEHRVVPGEQFVLDQKNETAGTMTLRHHDSGESLTIGFDLGSSISVVASEEK